jgi:hypothetical protein
MNLLNISLLAGIVAMVAWINWKSGKQPMFGYLWYGIWTVADVIVAAVALAQHNMAQTLLLAACAVINGIMWWQFRKRRKRKKAAALAGAKSRARIEALVRKVREKAKPRRVLKPQRVPL